MTPALGEVLAGLLYRHAWPIYRPLYFRFKRWQDATEIALARRLIRPGDVVVDVGANIGFHARLFAALVGRSGLVYAFEPDPLNHARLVATVQRFPQVIARNAALSDMCGELPVYAAPWLAVDQRTYPVPERRVVAHVEAVALDAVIPPGTSVRFVKVDVQGSEVSVLRGMTRVLAESPGVCLVLECWPWGLRAAGTALAEYEALLRAQGFRMHLVEGTSLVEQRSLAHLRDAPESRYWNVVASRAPVEAAAP